MNCDVHFWKSIRMSVFQRLKYGLKIVEILQKCCGSVDFLQEIVFDQVLVSFLVIIVHLAINKNSLIGRTMYLKINI